MQQEITACTKDTNSPFRGLAGWEERGSTEDRKEHQLPWGQGPEMRQETEGGQAGQECRPSV